MTTKEQAAQASREYYHRNKESCKARHKKWYTENKEYSLEQQREKKRQRKLWSIAYLGGCCSHCKQEFHPAVYEFHHTKPEEKDRDPSKMMLLSQEKLKLELDKCVLLCANCHRIEHHGDKY